ncbi:UNVERIFIED_CONTAM: hypothetical protein GTU68_051087 [Idotea baltica]|nr:hypothetical protein [Idotea baltica]
MNYYITTPIYYVNDNPHIGHAYTTILADVLSRYHKLFGDEVFFLTGTDEHGQKVQAAAEKRGMTPKDHVDDFVVKWKQIWDELNIRPDFFIRTTMDFHQEYVQNYLQELFDKGEIYQDEYTGWYSESEEIFYTEKDLIDGKSPEGKEVQKIVEKNYFFKMSKYKDKLIKHVEDNPEFIQPAGKRSEVLGFLKQDLNDLCISRPKSRLAWGIELPFDEDYVTYVWFDALINYISGIKNTLKNEDKFNLYWENCTHLIGKDILMTHAIYWSTMLMAMDIPLPKTIFAHGWWLNEEESKMSKSEGQVVSPLEVRDLVGNHGLRYFLTRDVHLGNDAKFSSELVKSRVNTELANKLGNLFSRITNLSEKYFDSKVPSNNLENPESLKIVELAEKTPSLVKEKIINLEPNLALGHIVDLLDATNKYIDTIAPWKSIKDDPKNAEESIYAALEVLRIAGILLHPVMPDKMDELLKNLSYSDISFENTSWGKLLTGTSITKGETLFPRIK